MEAFPGPIAEEDIAGLERQRGLGLVDFVVGPMDLWLGDQRRRGFYVGHRGTVGEDRHRGTWTRWDSTQKRTWSSRGWLGQRRRGFAEGLASRDFLPDFILK